MFNGQRTAISRKPNFELRLIHPTAVGRHTEFIGHLEKRHGATRLLLEPTKNIMDFRWQRRTIDDPQMILPINQEYLSEKLRQRISLDILQETMNDGLLTIHSNCVSRIRRIMLYTLIDKRVFASQLIVCQKRVDITRTRQR